MSFTPGTYKTRCGVLVNITDTSGKFLKGNYLHENVLQKPGKVYTQWIGENGRHIHEVSLDLVELIRSNHYDKYSK